MGAELATTPPVGTFRMVGGVRLAVDTRGEGGPPVVFLPGAGLTGLDYLHLHERAAAERTSLIYDRAGTGCSDTVRLPRSSTAVTDELHALLTATTPDPVLLVGHSLGGLYARHYATRFPDVTAGLVLLDPAHEDYDAAMPAELRQTWVATAVLDVLSTLVDLALTTAPTTALLEKLPPVRRYRSLYRDLFEQELSAWPADVRAFLVERHAGLDWLAVGLRESRKVEQLYAEVRRAGALPDVPLIILSSTGSDAFRDAVSSGDSGTLPRAEVNAKHHLYSTVAASVPRGEVRAVDSGHVTLPFRQSDAVIRAIRDVAH
jgi:pimeloyl-ACP methyl ester carboxylesterase